MNEDFLSQPERDTFGEYRKLIMAELVRLNEQLKSTDEKAAKIAQCNSELQRTNTRLDRIEGRLIQLGEDMAVQKFKSSLFGFLAGSIPALIWGLLKLLSRVS